MKIELIYGPPGTGKTTALMEELEKELQVHAPGRIAFVTFTKEGADNGRRRAMDKFGLKEEDLPFFGTLHSLAFRAEKMNRSLVISKQDYYELSKKLGMNFIGYYSEELKSNDDKYLFFNDVYRNTPSIATKYYLSTLDVQKLNFVRKNYSEYKRKNGIYDFTDMIELFIEHRHEINVDTVFVDEAQDLTQLQWKMIWTAFRNAQRIVVAGDDDQAIYQWSGADVEYFLSLHGESKVLDQSYRVPRKILALSKTISNQIEHRVNKPYNATDIEGEIHSVNTLDGIPFNNNETWMILCRNSWFLKDVCLALREQGLNYIDRTVHAIKKQDINAIKAYQEAKQFGMITGALLPQYVKKGYDLRNEWYDSLDFKEEYSRYIRNVLAKNGGRIPEPKIRVSTIHSVKGGEADNVVLLTDMTRETNKNLQRNPDSEHRVYYVGVTRAKKRLIVVSPSSKLSYPIYIGAVQ